MSDLTPALRARALREAADTMEADPGITEGRITGTGYTYFSGWLRDEADMWEAGEAPEQRDDPPHTLTIGAADIGPADV